MPNAKPKMTLGQKLKFMITGKYPEASDAQDVLEENNENISDTEVSTSEASTPQNPENSSEKKEEKTEKGDKKTHKARVEKFESETGMTLEKAESLLKKWKEKGENDKVAKGKNLISKYLPDYFSAKKEEKIVKNPENSSLKKSEKTSPDTQKEAVQKAIHSEEKPEKTEEISEKKSSSPKQDFVKKLADNPMQALGVTFSPNEDSLPDENSIEDDERLFGAMSYVPFISIFVIAMKQKSPFAQYHAWQAFTLLVISIMVGTFGWAFSFLGMGIIAHIITILIFIFSIFAGIIALRGRYITIPLVSTWAKTLSGRQ